MSKPDEVRWTQRLGALVRAISQLDDACARKSYTTLERAGLVQTFIWCCELGWKTLKDLLSYEGFSASSPRAVIRQVLEAEYPNEEDCETFLDAVSNRNTLSLAYSSELAREA